MTIALIGDVMLGRGVGEVLRVQPPDCLWSAGLREVALGCDLVICNLECCISERGERTPAIADKRFFFRAPPAAVESLAALGVRAVSLANNHALDFGEEALADTRALLAAGGIASVGAGCGPAAARRGAIVEAAGRRVGLLALTDHPREYAARASRWGVAFADLPVRLPDWARDELEQLRHEADLVIAFPHWGPNMTTSPAGWQRERAVELLGAGASLVAGHSAHLFHGVERHDKGLILYDLGDALDDYAVHESKRNDLGVLALWDPRGDPELELVGLHLNYAHTELASGTDADWIMARLARECRQLGTGIERTGEQRFALRQPAL